MEKTAFQPERAERCSACKHAQRTPATLECHRWPPHATAIFGKDSSGAPVHVSTTGFWAPVQDGAWCAEFSPQVTQ